MMTLSNSATIDEVDYSTIFGNHEGTIVVYNRNKDRYTVYNKKRSETRYTPCSTFKIPNSCIALETGVVENVDSVYMWDTTKYPSESWWPLQWHERHTMRTAIQYSVVPFYRNIASQIGKKRMQQFVKRFGYGNMDLSSGVDSFWLNGSLKISAMEQIEFLVKFYTNQFELVERTLKSVKSIIVIEDNGSWRLSAKTGGTSGIDKNNPERSLGWYVGYVEKGDNVIFFACNIDGESFADIRDARIEITRSVLEKLHVIGRR